MPGLAKNGGQVCANCCMEPWKDWQWRRVARERGLRIDWVVCLSGVPLQSLAATLLAEEF